MMSARSLFIMSVVKPETGLCCQVAPALVTSSPNAFIASPSAPALHCEMTVMRGSARTAAPETQSAAATPRDRCLLVNMAAPAVFVVGSIIDSFFDNPSQIGEDIVDNVVHIDANSSHRTMKEGPPCSRRSLWRRQSCSAWLWPPRPSRRRARSRSACTGHSRVHRPFPDSLYEAPLSGT